MSQKEPDEADQHHTKMTPQTQKVPPKLPTQQENKESADTAATGGEHHFSTNHGASTAASNLTTETPPHTHNSSNVTTPSHPAEDTGNHNSDSSVKLQQQGIPLQQSVTSGNHAQAATNGASTKRPHVPTSLLISSSTHPHFATHHNKQSLQHAVENDGSNNRHGASNARKSSHNGQIQNAPPSNKVNPPPPVSSSSALLHQQLIQSLSSTHKNHIALQHNLNQIRAQYESYIQSLRLRITEHSRNDERTMRVMRWMASELFVLHRERSQWNLDKTRKKQEVHVKPSTPEEDSKSAPKHNTHDNTTTPPPSTDAASSYSSSHSFNPDRCFGDVEYDDLDLSIDDDYQFLKKVDKEYARHSRKWRNEKSVGFLLDQNMNLLEENRKLRLENQVASKNRRYLEQNAKRVAYLEKQLQDRDESTQHIHQQIEKAENARIHMQSEYQKLFRDNMNLSQIVQEKDSRIEELESELEDMQQEHRRKNLLQERGHRYHSTPNYNTNLMEDEMRNGYSRQRGTAKRRSPSSDIPPSQHQAEYVLLPGERTHVEKQFKRLLRSASSQETIALLKQLQKEFHNLEEENVELKAREKEYIATLMEKEEENYQDFLDRDT